MSSSAAADGIDRTVTPAHEIPIRRQKRCYTTDSISDPWIEGQRDTLLQLKDGTRVVSPRTMVFVDDMLNQCNTALSQPFKTEYFEELVEGIQSSMPFLKSRLEVDDSYAAELESFTALGTENVLLKYGDYYAEGCNTIRSMAMGDDKKLLQGRKWKDIAEDIEQEEKALKQWEETEKTGATPITPIKDLIHKISLLWKDFDQKQIVAMIRFYADRNALAHNGLNDFIKKRAWLQLATLLRRDYHNVKIYYPQFKDDEKVEMLHKVIESCQKKFFVWIDEEWNDEGELIINSFKLKDEIIAEDDKIHYAKEKAKEDAENAGKLKSLDLGEGVAEPLTEEQMAELKDAQNAYQALIKNMEEGEKNFKKQKIDYAEKKEDFEVKIAEAKAQLEKAQKGG